MDSATILMLFAESGNKCPFMTTGWVGTYVYKLSMQQLESPKTGDSNMLGICSNSSIIIQGGHFSGTSFLYIVVRWSLGKATAFLCCVNRFQNTIAVIGLISYDLKVCVFIIINFFFFFHMV